MTIKRVLDWQRVRRIPAQFSWLDHRLVRDRHIERCDAPACALYLFLVTVADAQGLSYYADASIAKRLSMPSRYANGQYSRTSDGYLVSALAASTIRMILPSAPFSPNC